jgi:hypothetical protein
LRRVSIGDLQAGMVVAKPITNEAGMVMLSEGAALTDSLIRRLGSMEIGHVFVEGDAPDAKSRDERLADLEMRFRKTGQEKYMDTIKKVLKARIEEVYK